MVVASIFFAVIVLIDRLVKHYIYLNFMPGEMREFIPGFIDLLYHQNTGMAFSLLDNHQWVLLVTTPLLLAVVAFAIIRGMVTCKVQRLALVAIMAGGFSNWLSRLVYGFVVDMFSFSFVRFAVFNVADIFITVGAVVFCLFYLLEEQKKKKAKEVAEDA